MGDDTFVSCRPLLAVIARFTLAFINVGIYKSFGVFIDTIVTDLASDLSTVGFSCALFVGLGNLLGPFTVMFDELLSIRQMVMCGGFLTFFGLGIVYASPNGIILILGMFLAGVGQAFTQVPSVEPLLWYFTDLFSTFNGISLAGGAVGMMILPPVSEHLMDKFGWRGTIALLAAFSLNAVVAGANLKRPSYVRYQSIQSNTAKHSTSYKQVIAKLAEKLNVKLFREYPIFTIFQVICLCNGLLYTTWVLFLVPDAVSRGFTLNSAVYLSTFGGVGLSIGRTVSGLLVDWKIMSDINLYALLMVVLSVSFTIGTLAQSFWILSMLAFTVGICVGAQYPLAMTVVKGQVEEERWALPAISWIYLFQGAGNVLAGPITGWTKQVTGSYKPMFMGLGILHIGISIVTVVISKRSSTYSPI